MRPLLSPLVLGRRARRSGPACVHCIPQLLPGLEGRRGRAGDFQALAGPRISPCTGGSAPGAETSSPLARVSAIASNTASAASPAADFPTPVRAATRPAISDLFTRSLPALPRSRVARSARQTIAQAGAHGQHETSAVSIPVAAIPPSSCRSDATGVSHCQFSQCGFRRSRLACSRRLVGAGERPLAPPPGRPNLVQPHRRHSSTAAV